VAAQASIEMRSDNEITILALRIRRRLRFKQTPNFIAETVQIHFSCSFSHSLAIASAGELPVMISPDLSSFWST
jgi:hypothetical protein